MNTHNFFILFFKPNIKNVEDLFSYQTKFIIAETLFMRQDSFMQKILTKSRLFASTLFVCLDFIFIFSIFFQKTKRIKY